MQLKRNTIYSVTPCSVILQIYHDLDYALLDKLDDIEHLGQQPLKVPDDLGQQPVNVDF